jgi:hypothetical protein
MVNGLVVILKMVYGIMVYLMKEMELDLDLVLIHIIVGLQLGMVVNGVQDPFILD